MLMHVHIIERGSGNHPRAKCVFVSACTYIHVRACVHATLAVYVYNYIRTQI